MLSGKEDLLQALVEAFIMEKGSREFYNQAAEKSASQSAKREFEELSTWEAQHMGYIQSLYQSLIDDRELEEFREFSRKVGAPVAEGGIPVKDLEKKIETHRVHDEKDALAIALNIEAKAYNFYKDLAKRAGDPQAKVIFEEMMAQETKHLDHIHKMKQELSKH